MRIIAGQFKGRRIKTPKENTTRPTQGMLREAIFNICQNEIIGAHFLDLFAGSGAMGLEALSRGAESATFIEQNKNAVNCIRENIKTFELEKQAKVLPMSVERGIKKLGSALFNLIYIDPPYHLRFNLSLIEPLLNKNSLIFLETGNEFTEELPKSFKQVASKKFGAAYVAIVIPVGRPQT